MGRPALCKIAVLLLLLPLGGNSGQADSAVTLVYGSGVKVAALSKESVRAVFFMRERAWPDGTPIQVFVLPDDNPIHQRFAKEVLGVYPYQLRAAWDRMVYSGTGQAPIQVNTLQEMRERLRTTPGAVGYVLQNQIPLKEHTP